eukprot:1484116-Rhodomonas_salina.2
MNWPCEQIKPTANRDMAPAHKRARIPVWCQYAPEGSGSMMMSDDGARTRTNFAGAIHANVILVPAA